MQWLHRTLRSAEENLALDEALMRRAIESPRCGGGTGEVLRIWEYSRPLIVLGRSSRAEEEVDLAYCRRRGVEVRRRVSGGLSILTGPGCLMHCVVLSTRLRPELAGIAATHDLVLGRLVAALRATGVPAERHGTSDLALPTATGEAAPRKFSGNSLRVSRGWVLYHGTLLYDFPLRMIGEALRRPPRTPGYRKGRSHGAFVANAPVRPRRLVEALRAEWDARRGPATETEAELRHRVRGLVQERYARDEWTFCR